MTSLVLVLDDRSRVHLARALAEHAGWCRRNAVSMPDDLAGLLDALADSRGRSRPTVSVPDEPPVTISYETAAARLGVSRRTVGRWVVSGRLVRVGRRILAASVEGAQR